MLAASTMKSLRIYLLINNFSPSESGSAGDGDDDGVAVDKLEGGSRRRRRSHHRQAVNHSGLLAMLRDR